MESLSVLSLGITYTASDCCLRLRRANIVPTAPSPHMAREAGSGTEDASDVKRNDERLHFNNHPAHGQKDMVSLIQGIAGLPQGHLQITWIVPARLISDRSISVCLLTTRLIRCGIGAKHPEPVLITLAKQRVDCRVIQHGANVKDVTATCRFL